jgi:hypothetical protein
MYPKLRDSCAPEKSGVKQNHKSKQFFPFGPTFGFKYLEVIPKRGSYFLISQ